MAQELKARLLGQTMNEYGCDTKIYLKSEADKVIAHHKYKRCLAMAERCEDKIDNPVQCDEHDDWLIITEYWERWHKRWLELAEEFKEAK